MSSKDSYKNHPVPVTCKQLKSLHQTGDQTHIGHYPVGCFVIVAMVVRQEREGSKLTLDVEDGTSIIENLTSYDASGWPTFDEYVYVEIILHGTLNAQGDNATYFVKSVHPILDYSRVYQHQLAAYSFHLRNMVPPHPHQSHKSYLIEKNAQNNMTGPQTSTFTGINTVNFNAAPLPNNNQQNTMIMQGEPQDIVLGWLKEKSHVQDGFTEQQIANATRVPISKVHSVIEILLDSGDVFTALDDQHYSAV